jgi:hypothetical protein
MSNPKNTQYLVITPHAYDSGWTSAECHTEGGSIRRRRGPRRARPRRDTYSRHRRRNLPSVYPPRAGLRLATNEGPRNGPHHTKQNWRI